MRSAISAFMLASAVLSGCATYQSSYPENGEDQASFHVNQAKLAFERGDRTDALLQMRQALFRPTGETKLKQLFATNPQSKDIYRSSLDKWISEITSVDQANSAHLAIATAHTAGVISQTEFNMYMDRLQTVVANGNDSGSIPFTLSDSVKNFPLLNEPSHRRRIVDRAIAELQTSNVRILRPLNSLLDYVRDVGKDSAEGKRVESLLPTMNIRRDELDVVAKIFPAFAARRRQELSGTDVFRLKDGDRLLHDDLLNALRKRIEGVTWIAEPGPDTTVVTVERVRYLEKSLPERSQTITYAQGEVNFFSAALLMPRNVSYMYDIVSGSAEIEYGYVVTATIGGKVVHDSVVRGKVGGEYRRCQNDRIQNVFGGTSSAGFVANDDMRQRCSGPTSISMEELRNEVNSKLVEGVLQIPSIKAVHDMQ